MLTVGVDLGKRKSQYVVLDEKGQLMAERKLDNRAEVVKRFLRTCRRSRCRWDARRA